MIDLLNRCVPWGAGVLLGAGFFGGLWWTVRKVVSSRRPAFWLLGSMVLRTSIVMIGFFFVAAGRWERLLLCLVGFVTARLIVLRLTRESNPSRLSSREAGRAP